MALDGGSLGPERVARQVEAARESIAASLAEVIQGLSEREDDALRAARETAERVAGERIGELEALVETLVAERVRVAGRKLAEIEERLDRALARIEAAGVELERRFLDAAAAEEEAASRVREAERALIARTLRDPLAR